MKWHPEWLPRVSLILPTYWDRKIEWRSGVRDGLWEGGRVKGWIEVLWNAHQISKVNPLKRELILYLILLAAISPPFVLTQPPPSTPLLPLFTLSISSPVFFTLFSEGSVSKSSCWAAEGEAGKDEASRNDLVCVCVGVSVCNCWLSEQGNCEERWLCRLLLFLCVFSSRKALTAAVWFLRLSKVIFVSSLCQWMAAD